MYPDSTNMSGIIMHSSDNYMPCITDVSAHTMYILGIFVTILVNANKYMNNDMKSLSHHINAVPIAFLNQIDSLWSKGGSNDTRC